MDEFASDLPSYGYSSSPLIVDQRLMVEVGGKNAAFMAFHKETGKVAWRAGQDQPAYSSPIAVSIPRRRRSIAISAAVPVPGTVPGAVPVSAVLAGGRRHAALKNSVLISTSAPPPSVVAKGRLARKVRLAPPLVSA